MASKKKSILPLVGVGVGAVAATVAIVLATSGKSSASGAKSPAQVEADALAPANSKGVRVFSAAARAAILTQIGPLARADEPMQGPSLPGAAPPVSDPHIVVLSAPATSPADSALAWATAYNKNRSILAPLSASKNPGTWGDLIAVEPGHEAGPTGDAKGSSGTMVPNGYAVLAFPGELAGGSSVALTPYSVRPVSSTTLLNYGTPGDGDVNDVIPVDVRDSVIVLLEAPSPDLATLDQLTASMLAHGFPKVAARLQFRAGQIRGAALRAQVLPEEGVTYPAPASVMPTTTYSPPPPVTIAAPAVPSALPLAERLEKFALASRAAVPTEPVMVARPRTMGDVSGAEVQGAMGGTLRQFHVRPGETILSIAQARTGDPRRFVELLRHNPHVRVETILRDGVRRQFLNPWHADLELNLPPTWG